MRGYIYTLEVLIAVAIIFMSAVFIFGVAPVKPELEISIIKQQGFAALEHLDNRGILRQLNDTDLENQLRSLVSENIQLHVSSNSNTTELPEKTVVAIDYYIAGYRDSYLSKKIRLWLWEEL